MKRSPLFTKLSQDVISLSHDLGLLEKQRTIDYFSRLWLPLALDLANVRCKSNKTLIVGILGGQGMGKTTLCIVLKFILEALDFSVASLSLDDLYLTYAERQKLQQQNSRLIWRGPPGTHDIELGLKLLEQCLCQDTQIEVQLPRFDKSAINGSGDRTIPETISKPDILLFEGWFIGVQPIDQSYFDNPPLPIRTTEDIQFALDNNQHLQDYLPLWEKLDRLIILDPEDYRLSKKWRREAEQKIIASGKTGMKDEECDRFVEYFWKALHPELFINPLLNTADVVVEIKRDRSLGKIDFQSNKTNV